MAELICDICGGKLIMGSGGVATCNTCGMAYTSERLREKVQEIHGAVPQDNTHLIDNYLHIARNAYKSGNQAEAEKYCNKIIEIVPNHPETWFLKGCAAGWQSTLGNIRLAEATNCFANAIRYAEESMKKSLTEKSVQEVGDLVKATLMLRGERFSKFPDEDEKSNFIHDISSVLNTASSFFDQLQATNAKQQLHSIAAVLINNAVMDAWNQVICPTFANDHNGHPDDYELGKLLNRASYCIVLLNQAVSLINDDHEENIPRYENLISIHTYLINAQSYSYETVQVGNSNWDGSALYDNRYIKSKSLTDSVKYTYRQLITKYQDKINSIKQKVADANQKERQRKTQLFWDKHSAEQTTIIQAIDRLNRERSKLSSAGTGFNQINLIDTNISTLSEILEKDRAIDEKLSHKEQVVLRELPKLWDKIKALESEDAYFDHNPLLKEEKTIEQEWQDCKNSLRRATAPSYDEWLPRLLGGLALIAALIFFIVIGLLYGGWKKTSVFIVLTVFIYIPLTIGAIACLYKPIQRLIWYRNYIARLRNSIIESAEKLKQIDKIKLQYLTEQLNSGVISKKEFDQRKPQRYYEEKPEYPGAIQNWHITLPSTFAVIGIVAGFLDIAIATEGFKARYQGLLEFIVGSKAYTSAYLAIPLWILISAVLALIGFAAGKLINARQQSKFKI